jgi:integrase
VTTAGTGSPHERQRPLRRLRPPICGRFFTSRGLGRELALDPFKRFLLARLAELARRLLDLLVELGELLLLRPVRELSSLRWRDLDLAGGKLRVTDSKTDAGVRVVELTPSLLDDLKLHRAEAGNPDADALVFATRNGTARDRSNVTHRVLVPAIERANVELQKAGRKPIESVTNHSLRRTFCALLYEAGASPAYVMQQMGHTSANLALEIYTKVMERKRDTGERMDALLRGADWAQAGTNPVVEVEAPPVVATRNPA